MSDETETAVVEVEETAETFARQFGTPTPSQMEQINKLAKVALKPEQVFSFPAKLAGDMVIPNRYIKLDKSLLNVFKKDAQAGVALMLDHSWASYGGELALVYGRTFDAQLKKSDSEEEDWALYADHYLVRGKEKNGISTDSLIADISDGTAFDTSIGWGSSVYECSICGNDIRSYKDCEHYMGQTYDGEVCYAIAKPPGYLMENSIVFDGAYPGAGILSQLEKGGDSGFVAVDDLKGIPLDVTLFHVYSATKGRLMTFAKKEDMAQGANLLKGGDSVGETLKEQEQEQQEQQQEQVVFYMTREQAEEKLNREIEPEEVLRLAVEGEKFLTELRDDAGKWGIRALGNDFDTEAWAGRLSGMDSVELKNTIKTFQQQAEAVIAAGRQTEPGAKGGETKRAFTLPDEAYGL